MAASGYEHGPLNIELRYLLFGSFRMIGRPVLSTPDVSLRWVNVEVWSTAAARPTGDKWDKGDIRFGLHEGRLLPIAVIRRQRSSATFYSATPDF